MDIRLALGYIGDGFDFGGSVTDNTEACWDSVDWNDERAKPTWSELVTAYDDYVFFESINQVEKEFSDKCEAFDIRMRTVTLKDGTQQEQKVLAIQQEYAAASAERQAALDALWGI